MRPLATAVRPGYGSRVGEKRLGIALIAAGAALLLLALLAEPLGIEGAHGFGWKQTVGVIAGGVLILVGLAAVTLARGQASADRTRHA